MSRKGMINPLAMMEECAQMAIAARGATLTNPVVGAAVVKDGTVIGRGIHEKFGEAHAEINAIAAAEKAGHDVSGADLYVTLEPCSHTGKTPPCAEAILEKGIKRVFVGVADPNPRVAGRGIDYLNENGVEVFVGYTERLCASIIEEFAKFTVTGLPFVTAKAAMSLDGRIATRELDSKWITNESSRAYSHYLRSVHNAVIVGIGTVLIDDPALTVRSIPSELDPYKVVIDPMLRIPMNAKLVTESAERLIVATGPDAPESNQRKLMEAGAKVLRVPFNDGAMHVETLLRELAALNVGSVLVEGGGRTLGSFFDAGMVDAVQFFYAPIIIGGKDAPSAVEGDGAQSVATAPKLIDSRLQHFGRDILVMGRVHDYTAKTLELTETVRNRCSRES